MNSNNQYPVKGHQRSCAHRADHRRKVTRKIRLLCLVTGACSGIFGLIITILALFNTQPAKDRYLKMGTTYLIISIVLLFIRFVLGWLKKKRRHVRKQPASSRPCSQTDMQAGSVLIMVLVFLGLTAGVVLQAQMLVRLRLQHQEIKLQEQLMQQAGFDAIWSAIDTIANDDNLLVDHLDEDWSMKREFITPNGISILIEVVDENRFFNLNTLSVENTTSSYLSPSELLMNIMTLAGDFTPIDKVDALKDWIDTDQEGFYENTFYQEQDPPYETADRALYTWQDILLVNGFTHETFIPQSRLYASDQFKADLNNMITIYAPLKSSPTPININTADKITIQALLGIEYMDLADTLIATRQITPIRSLELVYAAIPSDLVELVRPWLSVQSSLFRIHVRAFKDGASRDFLAVAQRDNDTGEVSITKWVF